MLVSVVFSSLVFGVSGGFVVAVVVVSSSAVLLSCVVLVLLLSLKDRMVKVPLPFKAVVLLVVVIHDDG